MGKAWARDIDVGSMSRDVSGPMSQGLCHVMFQPRPSPLFFCAWERERPKPRLDNECAYYSAVLDDFNALFIVGCCDNEVISRG